MYLDRLRSVYMCRVWFFVWFISIWSVININGYQLKAILNQASCTCTQCDSYIESSIMYSYTM